MKVVIKNSSLVFASEHIVVDENIKTLLTNAYGTLSEAKMVSFQKFANAIGWGKENSIYSKIKILIIPFLLNASKYSSLENIFFNLKSGAYEQFGINSLQNEMKTNTSKYFDLSTKGLLLKRINGAYSGFENYNNTTLVKNYRPFMIFEYVDNIDNYAQIAPLGNNREDGTGYGLRYSNEAGYDSSIRINDGKGNTKFDTDYQFISTKGILVIGDNKAFGMNAEITANINNLSNESYLTRVNFGGFNADGNSGNNSEKAYFKLFGFADGLSDAESATLRNALVKLKSELGMN